MMCEKCGKNPSTVLYTQIVNGKKSSLNICSQCASGESLFENFGSLLSFGVRSDTEVTACPCCGMTLAEFTHKGRVGCGKCYDTFRSQAKNMLQKIHGTSVHAVQEKKSEEKSEIDILRESLQKAIESENYEEAAKIRDQIRSKEGK